MDGDLVRGLYKRPKWQLVEEIEKWARKNGRSWLVGGPRQWTKDEAVSAVLRIRRGEEP